MNDNTEYIKQKMLEQLIHDYPSNIAQVVQNQANIDYIAMMTEIDIPTESEVE